MGNTTTQEVEWAAEVGERFLTTPQGLFIWGVRYDTMRCEGPDREGQTYQRGLFIKASWRRSFSSWVAKDVSGVVVDLRTAAWE